MPHPLNDAQNWPAIPVDLLRAIEDFANQHCAAWQPGMTGYDAIGHLARVQGMGRIVDKLKAVRKKQLELAAKRNIPSHVRK